MLATIAELGFTAPTPIQQAVIPPLREGRDLIGRARTGSGKTAAFGLPMLERVANAVAREPNVRAVRALVLAPTRELALQVTDALRQLGEGLNLQLLTVYGGSSYTPQLRGLQRGASIVVGTPGRLIDLLDKGALDLGRVEYVVLDEADEMLAMGFIDDVERILADTPASRQIALLSATMPPAIRRIAETTLRDPVTIQTDGGRPTVDHIAQRWMAVPQQHKADALVRLLQAEPLEATLVFVRTRAGCDDVVATLANAGVDALALHGDMNQPAREQVLARLRDDRVRVVVATDVAARGLDVEHLAHVVNFDLPDNAEVYTHRIGRTGRAGRAGRATTLVASSFWQRFLGICGHLRADVDEIRPPSDAAIATAQRAAMIDWLMGDVVAGAESAATDEGDEGDDTAPRRAPSFDGARLAVARQWVADLAAERNLDPAELAALAIVRIADARGVALLADVDRSLPAWAPHRPAPRHLRGGRPVVPPRAEGPAREPQGREMRPDRGERFERPERAPRGAEVWPQEPRGGGERFDAGPRQAERGVDRGPDRGPDRGSDRGSDKGFDRGHERGPQRDVFAQGGEREPRSEGSRRYERQQASGRFERTGRPGWQGDAGRGDDSDHVELFVPVGSNRGVTPADLVGAIASAGDLSGRAIGKIRIHDKVSFVALPAAAAEAVLERVETLMLRGMKVAVLRARPMRRDGEADEAGRRDGGRGDGPRFDGPRFEGPRFEGPRADGPRVDAPRGEDSRSDEADAATGGRPPWAPKPGKPRKAPTAKPKGKKPKAD